eukprot:276756-Pyramimonas_sp.AAC.1
MDPPKKKPKVIQALQAAGLKASGAQLTRILKNLCDEETVDTPLADVNACVRKYVSELSTPYGPVIQTLDLPLSDGTSYSWPVANPLSLTYYLCRQSPSYA